MSGYNYAQGMSNRAVDAYDRGLIPLSRLTAGHLREVGWKGTLKQAKALAKAEIWKPCLLFYFYDPRDLVDNELQPIDEVKEKEKAVRVRGVFEEFSRSGRRVRHCGSVHFEGELRGDWIYLDGGGKKKASGNHITYHHL